ncbi:MAG: acetyl-CoA C-acetyltransferase [Pseudomonadota bacterium]
MPDAYIFDHLRSPRGKGRPGGGLYQTSPIELTTQLLQAAKSRNELDTSQLADVTLGCVTPTGEQGSNIARIAVLNAGFDEGVAGKQVNRYCASGLEAVNIAAGEVMAGQAQLTIGGGVESMSRVPMGADGGAWTGDPQVAFRTYFTPQGIGADLIATKYGYSRDDVDAYAVESQRRAKAAWDDGRFDGAIVPIKDQLGGTALERDEYMRPGTSMQDLGALNPAFAGMGEKGGFDTIAKMRYPEIQAINHVHHAGNSSGIVDGAALVLMGTEVAGQSAGLTPRARILSYASVGSEPTIMLTGPSAAAERALANAGLTRGDIDLFELNEAFASVVLRFMEALDVDHADINVNGGAIAMGHPLGATGAMILGTLLDELERRDQTIGLATLCVGAGMGIATIIERV